uniref:Zinc finger protein 395b n=1 Tax=Labrus bergylta TaxID=56723 RepID=A0A3Q3N599_9LABR
SSSDGTDRTEVSTDRVSPRRYALLFSSSRFFVLHFRSPESVEMDEIMAAMVLTSLSFGSASSVDMECGGGELSDSGSSGYWSWDHGNGSPAPSPSVTEMDSSPDEGLHMELEQGEELNAKKTKSSFRGVYKCLWPSCGKVLTSSVGIKRHIRVLHLGWASCGSPSASEPQISPAYRPRSNSSSGPGQSQSSTLSQSAPSSFWQIHSEHLYQVGGMIKPRCRSVSVGEQWLQQNRLQPISVSPSRNHCSFRKGRGEAKKCRKVYGVERKDQWCTACRWKKACQRFPD